MRRRREQTADQRLHGDLDSSLFVLGLEGGAVRKRYPDASWNELRLLLGWKRYRDVIPEGVPWPEGPVAMRVVHQLQC